MDPNKEAARPPKEASSSVVYPTMEGGVSPLPDPVQDFQDDWTYQYFIVVPLNGIKEYNHGPVKGMISNSVVRLMGDSPAVFPPPFEAWDTHFSFCIRLACTRNTFEKIRERVKGIYTDFSGPLEMLKYYQTSSSEQM